MNEQNNIIEPFHYNETEKIIMGFWAQLPMGATILAPMADVTDIAFRKIIAKYSRKGEPGGGPDVFYTEFVAADGLASPIGRPRLLPDLAYSEQERPIIAQLFSSSPKNMEQAARLVVELGFDGIDINMGCPDDNVCKQGAGSAMIKTPELAQEVIRATIRGAQGKIPVSVKTRVGWTQNEIATWIPAILDCDIAAIILHGRTRKVMSKIPANWDWIADAVALVRASGKQTRIYGNGDIESLAQARAYTERYGVDGVMIGRGIFGNPWLFDSLRTEEPGVSEKLEVLLEHTRLFLELLGDRKNFAIMKKHYKAYVNGFDGAKELRVKLMEAESYSEIEKQVREFLSGWVSNDE